MTNTEVHLAFSVIRFQEMIKSDDSRFLHMAAGLGSISSHLFLFLFLFKILFGNLFPFLIYFSVIYFYFYFYFHKYSNLFLKTYFFYYLFPNGPRYITIINLTVSQSQRQLVNQQMFITNILSYMHVMMLTTPDCCEN